MQDVLISRDEQDEMRRKVGAEPWAAALLQRLRESTDCDPLRQQVAYERALSGNPSRDLSRLARDLALIHAVTGEEEPLATMVELVESLFQLDDMSSTLGERTSADGGGRDACRVQFGGENWAFGLMYGGCFYAYDLTRQHPIWTIDGRSERLETRFRQVLDAAKWRQGRQRSWRNTACWYSATVGLLGAMLDDDEAVEIAIDGPLGFKAILSILQDGGLFPEPIAYGHGYVKCVLTIIAELARHTGAEDLYQWQTSEGVSLRSMYDRFLEMVFADGRLAGHGDSGGGSEHANVPGQEEASSTGRLWHHEHGRGSNTFEIAYRAYRDPRYAWVLSQTPGRATWDHAFFGCSALTHGVPLGPTEPPDATSKLFRQYGGAIIRGDETESYWNGPAPTVYLRGGTQAHGHNDTGNILLNAFGRNLYPDIQYAWDYQPRIDRETGEDLNPGRFGKTRIAHNTVSVNFCNNVGDFPQLAALRRSGPMTIAVLYHIENQIRRTIGVTPEYVFDWACAGLVSHATRHNKLTYDYHLHSVGMPELTGVDGIEPYTTLCEEYGLGPIDTRSDDPDNRWIYPGVSGMTDTTWHATMVEHRPLAPAEPRGVRLHMLGEPGTHVIMAQTPDYVNAQGWDASQPESGKPNRLGMLVVRRHAVTTEFLAIHQPFCGSTPPPLDVQRQGNVLSVRGLGFEDRIELAAVRCHRDLEADRERGCQR